MMKVVTNITSNFGLKLIIIGILTFSGSNLLAQNELPSKQNEIGVKDYQQNIGGTNIIKFTPALAGLNPKGAVFIYETGSGLNLVSLQLSAKIFAGSIGDNVNRPVQAHYKFEVQPKFYAINFFESIYFGPLFAIYNDGTGSIGASTGVQLILKRKLALDMNIGIQSTNEIENQNNPAPIFVRYSIAFGLVFERKAKKSND